LKTYECRCDERLKGKGEGSTRFVYTGFRGGLEHPKRETRLIDEKFESVMGECDLEPIGCNHGVGLRSVRRMLQTLVLSCEENTE
jgi:hypothetical protein